MEIFTPGSIPDPVFDGYLQAEEAALRGSETRAQVGRTEWWFLGDLLGPDWKPPQGDSIHLLLRVSFSLDPPRGHEVQEARLQVTLTCSDSPTADQPVAFDLFPREVMEEAQTDLKITIGPSLKLAEKASLGLGSVETTIHIPKVEPVITTFGIGGSTPEWIFRRHRRYPILGSRLVYAVVAYPSAADEMDVTLGLQATVRAGRFGIWHMRVPDTALPPMTQQIP